MSIDPEPRPVDAGTHLRIARPSRAPAAVERFYVAGLGLAVLYRATAAGPAEHDLLMLGWPEASWHLEIVSGPGLAVRPGPTAEDLLVLYLAGPLDDALVTRLEAAGGKRVSQGPYWDRWGVTFEDPDGYRLVLCTRDWSNTG
ncbi:VOC family protein [Plantactinospora sp. WMMB782]|uniref:VOC family protein n=1 Tax=Plantactinospora sp. WMMB782 TaxID=3404121 RepID=UPI003B94863F